MINASKEKDKIRDLIYKKEYTLQQTADLYGVSRQYIHKLLKQWGLPPLKLIRKPKNSKPNKSSLYDRFFSNVKITPSCWIWTGYTQRGYGRVSWWRHTKEQYVHRISWKLFRGDILPNEWVIRTCKNKSCVNPTHLELKL